MQQLTRLTFLLIALLLIKAGGLNAQSRGSKEQQDSIERLFINQRLSSVANRGVSSGSSVSAKRYAERTLRSSGILSMNSSQCPDTSERFFLTTNDYYLYVKTPYKTRSGDLVIAAEYSRKTPPYKTGAALIRCDYDGNVKWTKLYDSSNNLSYQYHWFYKVLELSDGSLLAVGKTTNPITHNNDLLLIKTNANGDVIWNKVYNSRFWTGGSGSADYFYVQQIKQDPYTNDVYLCGPFWTDGKCIVKINPANGNIVWGKSYKLPSGSTFDLPFGFDIRQNDLVYFGRNNGYSNYNPISIIRVNKTTGDTLQTKVLQSEDPAGYRPDILTPEELVKLDNGNYIVSGKSFGYWSFNWDKITPLYHATVIEIDSALNFVRAYNFRSAIESNSYNTRISVHPDGSGMLNYMQFISGYTANIFMIQFKNGQILKQRKLFYSGMGMPDENKSIKTPDGGDLLVKLLGDSALKMGKIEFLKLHISDTSSACLGVDDYSTFVHHFTMKQIPYGFDSVKVNPFNESQTKTFTVTPISLSKEPGCFIVSYCDTLALSTPDSTICLGDSVLLSIHKNIACGTTVPISFDTSAVQYAVYVNDSTLKFKFKKTWRGYISASLQGCSIIKDSVFITVLKAPDSLSLGRDTILCAQNSILLNAKDGYRKYRWQNGSTDSTFLVTQPGKYHVTTEDACGNIFSDTIDVAAAPPVPLNVGPDRTKCNSDTLQLSAPTGFLNYSWSPAYNISSLTTRQIVVNPLVDTTYYLKAEKTPGCFGFDTVRIKVNTSPAIRLGNDTSFCNGQSITLSAGTGFTSYQWNNGGTNAQATISNKGIYSVIGTTAEGCKSYDTLQVLNVYANPVVRLNKDTTLCMGASRLLDAGNFSSYLWNNGSVAQSITVTGPGIYKVTVTDVNGCKGTDSSSIKVLHPLPARFLLPDTSICSYGSLVLFANTNFQSYLWNTNAGTSTIEIKKPGQYWLQVTDTNGCLGKDTVTVLQKECMVGLYVPTAFTPDGNGLNDDFKPMLFGDVEQFQFTVFNRWGQILFQTNDRLKGWDGNWKGTPQIPGIYIWSCSYKLANEKPVLRSGTVTLIR